MPVQPNSQVTRSFGPRSTRAVLISVASIVLLVGLTGIDEPVRWGHYGFHVGEWGQSARVSLRHGIWGTAPKAGLEAPTPADFKLHHPFLVFYPPIVASVALFGDTVWAVRLPTLLITTLTTLLLGWTVKRYWDAPTAIVVTIIYACLPMTVAFAHNPDTQAPAILGGLVALYGYTAFTSEPTRQRLVLIFIGFFLALASDWTLYFAVAFVSVHAGIRALWSWKQRPKGFGLPLDLWVGIGATLLATSVFGSFLYYVHINAQGGLTHSREAFVYRLSTDYAQFCSQHTLFVGGMYGGPLLATSGVGLLMVLMRLVRGKPQPRDIIAVSLVFANVVWALIFTRAANAHVYRTMVLAIPVAILASEVSIALGRTLGGALGSGSWSRFRPWVASLPSLLLVAHTAVLGAKMLKESRRVGGTLFQRPSYDPERPKMEVARHIHETTRPSDAVYIDRAIPHRREVTYIMDRSHYWAPPPAALISGEHPVKSARVAWLDGRALSVHDRRKLMKVFDTEHIDRYFIVRLSPRANPEVGPIARRYELKEVESGWVERWLRHPVLPRLVLQELPDDPTTPKSSR